MKIPRVLVLGIELTTTDVYKFLIPAVSPLFFKKLYLKYGYTTSYTCTSEVHFWKFWLLLVYGKTLELIYHEVLVWFELGNWICVRFIFPIFFWFKLYWMQSRNSSVICLKTPNCYTVVLHLIWKRILCFFRMLITSINSDSTWGSMHSLNEMLVMISALLWISSARFSWGRYDYRWMFGICFVRRICIKYAVCVCVNDIQLNWDKR